LIWSILLALQLPEYLLSSPTLIHPQCNPYMLSSFIKTWLLSETYSDNLGATHSTSSSSLTSGAFHIRQPCISHISHGHHNKCTGYTCFQQHVFPSCWFSISIVSLMSMQKDQNSRKEAHEHLHARSYQNLEKARENASWKSGYDSSKTRQDITLLF